MRQSESARMATAKEARFRIPYPNSQPRSLKIIALDSEAAKIVDEVSRKPWNRAVFFTSLSFPAKASASGDQREQMQAWLSDVAGHAKSLVDEIASADSVIVVASAGEDAEAASLVGEICQARHKSMIGLLLRTPSVTDADLSRTLVAMRPFTTMLVVASGQIYVEEMLTAMRA